MGLFGTFIPQLSLAKQRTPKITAVIIPAVLKILLELGTKTQC